MPPEPGLFVGRKVIVEYWAEGFDQEGFGRMTGVVTRANMQPAVGCYRAAARRGRVPADWRST